MTYSLAGDLALFVLGACLDEEAAKVGKVGHLSCVNVATSNNAFRKHKVFKLDALVLSRVLEKRQRTRKLRDDQG